MKNYRVTTLALLIVGNMFSQPVMAENPMKDIFQGMMTNSTSPTTFNTAKRFGATGGGFSARIPRITPNIISVVPPKLDVGCGGADFFTGSFSIINKDQMVQVMRGIANGAATYAFSVGMQAVCATCMSTLESLSSELNKLNALSRDACSKSYEWIADTTLGKAAAEQASENSLFKPKAVSFGLWDDAGDAASSQQKGLSKAVAANPNVVKEFRYNLVWKQLKEQQVQNWNIEGQTGGYNWNELMLSLLGTMIVDVKSDSSGEKVQASEPRPPTIVAKDLMKSGATVNLLRCGSDQDECMNPISTPVTNWKGLGDIIRDRLMTIHASLALRDYSQLSDDDKRFLNITDASFVQYLERVPYGGADTDIALYSTILANQSIGYSIAGFVVRLQNWMGANKLDQEAKYMDQLATAMRNLKGQMDSLSTETLEAQEKLTLLLQQRDRLTKQPGQNN